MTLWMVLKKFDWNWNKHFSIVLQNLFLFKFTSHLNQIAHTANSLNDIASHAKYTETLSFHFCFFAFFFFLFCLFFAFCNKTSTHFLNVKWCMQQQVDYLLPCLLFVFLCFFNSHVSATQISHIVLVKSQKRTLLCACIKGNSVLIFIFMFLFSFYLLPTPPEAILEKI